MALGVRLSAQRSRATLVPDSEQVAQWAELAATWGFQDFLSPEDSFKTCLKSNRPWSGKDRPGIYFWLADNGEAYVGQSIKPQGRLREHWREHRDVAQACFMPCRVEELDAIEEAMISRAGRCFELRNIKHAVSTTREVPFDKVVSDSERAVFISGGHLVDEPWRPMELATRLQARKTERFAALPSGPAMLAAARLFVGRAIPRPAATELGFWSITLFPKERFLRINAGQQEVFTAEVGSKGVEVRVLTDRRVSLFRSFKARYRVESYVTSFSAAELAGWLRDEYLRSCRRLVVRLMRHTTALNSGSHCPQAVRCE